jgi:hypothetical protein
VQRTLIPRCAALRTCAAHQDIKRDFPTVLVLGGAHCAVTRCVTP